MPDEEYINKANETLNNIPFSTLIGGPIQACIQAQKTAAMASWDYLHRVGLQDDGNGNLDVVNVSFSFVIKNQMMQMNIPLLTIVPIPFLSVETLDIEFNACVTSYGSKDNIDSFCAKYSKIESGAETVAKEDKQTFTSGSNTSYENNLNIKLHASQDNMPPGISLLLNKLDEMIEIVDQSAAEETKPVEFYFEEGKFYIKVLQKAMLPLIVQGDVENLNAFDWETSNSNVVSVSQTGEISAKNAGEAIISVSLDSQKAYCHVFVSEEQIESPLSDESDDQGESLTELHDDTSGNEERASSAQIGSVVSSLQMPIKNLSSALLNKGEKLPVIAKATEKVVKTKELKKGKIKLEINKGDLKKSSKFRK